MADTNNDKADRVERIRNGIFKQDGYNSGVDMPVDIEPVPKDAPGAAIDVRDMPQNGVIEIHDDDNDILDREQESPISK